MAISYPGQAGDVEEVGCLPRQDVPAVPVGLLVRQELGVKGGQIGRKRGEQLGKALILWVKVNIAGRDMPYLFVKSSVALNLS